MKIKTAGDLRSFLADVMVGIRDGNIDYQDATAISKVAAQINNSLAVEVNTALRLTGMGKDHPGPPIAIVPSRGNYGNWRP